MSSIQLDTLLRLLGVSKDDEREREVRRILDGTIPRVDFVNLGANGYGEDGFLVKKGRNMLGTMQFRDGKWVFVQKSEDKPEDENPGIKMSGATKQGLAAQIAALQKVHDAAEEDDSVEGIPEEVLQILGVTKEAEPEGKQGAKTEPEPTTEPEAEPTVQVPTNLDGLFKNLTEAAGASAETEEFQGLMGQLLGMLAPEQQAIAEVNKSVKTALDARDKKIAQLEAAVKALAQGSGFSLKIPDGANTKKQASQPKPDNPYAAAAGMNLSRLSDDPKRRYKLPQ